MSDTQNQAVIFAEWIALNEWVIDFICEDQFLWKKGNISKTTLELFEEFLNPFPDKD